MWFMSDDQWNQFSPTTRKVETEVCPLAVEDGGGHSTTAAGPPAIVATQSWGLARNGQLQFGTGFLASFLHVKIFPFTIYTKNIIVFIFLSYNQINIKNCKNASLISKNNFSQKILRYSFAGTRQVGRRTNGPLFGAATHENGLWRTAVRNNEKRA
jgi:hypothetical protein